MTTSKAKLPAPASFRSRLLIEPSKRFRPAPFQVADFEAIDAALLRMISGGRAKQRLWIERPRGSSKTTDIALAVLWALVFAPHQIQVIAGASDADQAGLLRAAIERLINLNNFLRDQIEVMRWEVRNKVTGSTLEILSSDAGSAYGHLVDLIVCDELSHWPEGRGEEFWTALYSAAAKKPNVAVLCISNAGFRESWVWRLREAVRVDLSWHFTAHTEPAPWIKPSTLAEQERLLPRAAFARLWRNEWVDGGGDAIDEVDLRASVILDGPQSHPEPGWTYYLGADAAVSGDRAALVLVGCRSSRVQVAAVRSWRPTVHVLGRNKKRIDLANFEAAILDLARRFDVVRVAVDPFQMELSMQRLQAAGVSCVPVHFTATPAQEMASAVMSHFANRSIALWECDELLRDLRRLRIVETRTGFRLDAPRTKDGHCDTAIALALALWASRSGGAWLPVDDFAPELLVHGRQLGLPGAMPQGRMLPQRIVFEEDDFVQ